MYLFALMFNGGKIYQQNINDIINIFSLICLLLYIGKINVDSLQAIKVQTFKYISFIFPIIGLLAVAKFLMQQKGQNFSLLHIQTSVLPMGTSLKSDYNMFALGFCISLIALMYCYNRAKKKSTQIYYILGILINGLTIAFSGSRRGWVVLGIIVLIFLLKLLFGIFKRQKRILISFSVTTVAVAVLWNLLGKGLIFSDSIAFRVIESRFTSLENFGQSYSGRTDRWIYGIELFKEYNTLQLIIGNGFLYLPKFAEMFTSNIAEDYPHNPIISALLYSGILGAFISIMIIFIPLIIYMSIIKKIGIEFTLIYMISLLFLISSGNSLFSNNLLLLLICLSFLTRKKQIRKESGNSS